MAFQLLFEDTFVRPNTTVGSGGVSTVQWGPSWTLEDSRYGKVAGGKGIITGGAINIWRSSAEALTADCYAEADIPINFPTNNSVYVCCGFDATNKTHYAVRFRADGAGISLWKGVTGTRNSISHSGTGTFTYDSSHVYLVTIKKEVVSGNAVITATVRDVTAGTGAQTITATDTAPSAVYLAAGCGAVWGSGSAADIPIDAFRSYYSGSAGMTASVSSIEVSGADVVITLTGSGTSFTGSPFTLANGGTTEAEIITQTCLSGTSAEVRVRPGSVSGGFVLKDTVSGAAIYIGVVPVTVTPSPATLAVGVSGASVAVAGAGTQWTSGSSPFSFVSGPTGSSLVSQTVGGDPGSLTLSINSGSEAGTIVLHDSTSGKNLYIGVIALFDYDQAHIRYSPGNWRDNGTSMQTSNTGAYVKAKIPGSACSVVIDVTGIAAQAGMTYPRIAWTVDGSRWQFQTLTSSSSTISLYSNLDASIEHEIWMLVEAMGTGTGIYNKWGSESLAPTEALIITGWYFDGTPVAPTLRTKKLGVFGDSRTQSNIVAPYNSTTASASFLQGYVRPLADALDAEFDCVGFSSQGWTKYGTDGIPPFHDGTLQTWDKKDAQTARDLAAIGYDYILVNHGTNDDLQAVSSSVVQAAVEDFLQEMRAALPNAWIFLLVPFGQRQRTAIVAAYNSVPRDSKMLLLDPPDVPGLRATAASDASGDGIHPRADENAREAAWLARQMQETVTTGAARSRLGPAVRK